MKLLSSLKNKVDFYLKNYKVILDDKSEDEVSLRTAFKSRKYHREKYIKVKLTDDDRKWSCCIEKALKSIEYDKIAEAVELAYIKRKDIEKICDEVGIEQSTYYSWMNDVRFYILYFVFTSGLIDESEIRNVILF